MNNTGKILIIVGLVLVVAGLIIWLAGDKFNWFGRLPGDIKIERENTRFYFPITTMIILSILVSGIMWIIRKFF
ncbi:MAG TPA: DUF2905 domain-containing protein [Bacteroidales bacterium]|nr:DUF2905 domain-containing protein [Bacteroidales bacterium]